MKLGAQSARVFTPPATIATNGTAAFTFDTKGYDEAIVDITFGTAATNAAELTTMQFLEGDTTSAYVAITALTGGTNAGNFTLPTSAAIGAGAISQFQIDLRKRKRYLQFACTPGAARIIGADVQLFRAEVSPQTAAGKSIGNIDATSCTAVAQVVQV